MSYKRKTINLEKLRDFTTEDLQEVAIILVKELRSRSQLDVENDIMCGLDKWEQRDKDRRTALNVILTNLENCPPPIKGRKDY